MQGHHENIVKMQVITDSSITCSSYTPTTDNALEDLKLSVAYAVILRIIQNMRKCYKHQTNLHD